MSSMENIATRSARLQAEISNKQLAAWLAKNEQQLLAQPELLVKEATPIKPAQPETMREYYSKQDPNFTPIEEQIKKVSTFKTKGLSNAQIEDFLNTADGKKLLGKL